MEKSMIRNRFKWGIKHQTLMIAAIPLVLMVAVSTKTSGNLQKMDATSEWVNHTYEVLEETANITAYAVDMETGLRGFLLAGRNEFLEPYEAGREGEIKITNIIEDTPWCSATFKLIAKPTTQLKPIAIDVFLLAKFESGRMTEHYTGFDYFSLFSQLGQIPENSLEHCLLGGNLTWT